MKINNINLHENDTLLQIVKLIALSDEKTFPVLNKKNEVTGIINSKVLIKLFIPGYFTLLQNFDFVDDFGPLEKLFSKQIQDFINIDGIIAKDIMITDVIKITENSSILKASSIMISNNIEFLPIVNMQNKFIGSITEKAILKYLLYELKS